MHCDTGSDCQLSQNINHALSLNFVISFIVVPLWKTVNSGPPNFLNVFAC